MTYKFRSDHFEQGRRAAWDGLPVTANPYTNGTVRATLWVRGWNFVQKPARDLSHDPAHLDRVPEGC